MPRSKQALNQSTALKTPQSLKLFTKNFKALLQPLKAYQDLKALMQNFNLKTKPSTHVFLQNQHQDPKQKSQYFFNLHHQDLNLKSYKFLKGLIKKSQIFFLNIRQDLKCLYKILNTSQDLLFEILNLHQDLKALMQNFNLKTKPSTHVFLQNQHQDPKQKSQYFFNLQHQDLYLKSYKFLKGLIKKLQILFLNIRQDLKCLYKILNTSQDLLFEIVNLHQDLKALMQNFNLKTKPSTHAFLQNQHQNLKQKSQYVLNYSIKILI